MAEVNAFGIDDSVDRVLVLIWSSLSTDGLYSSDIANQSPTPHYAL